MLAFGNALWIYTPNSNEIVVSGIKKIIRCYNWQISCIQNPETQGRAWLCHWTPAKFQDQTLIQSGSRELQSSGPRADPKTW